MSPHTTDSCNLLEKSNVLLLSKEMNEKYRSLKTLILVSTTNGLEKNKKTEKVWSKNGFYGDEKGGFNISKKYFLEKL